MDLGGGRRLWRQEADPECYVTKSRERSYLREANELRYTQNNTAVSCMRNASGHSYRNSSFIVELAMGRIPRCTEHISSFA